MSDDVQKGLQLLLQLAANLAIGLGLPATLWAMLNGCTQPSEALIISEPSATAIVETIRETPLNEVLD
jgi:hypothetical protein